MLKQKMEVHENKKPKLTVEINDELFDKIKRAFVIHGELSYFVRKALDDESSKRIESERRSIEAEEAKSNVSRTKSSAPKQR